MYKSTRFKSYTNQHHVPPFWLVHGEKLLSFVSLILREIHSNFHQNFNFGKFVKLLKHFFEIHTYLFNNKNLKKQRLTGVRCIKDLRPFVLVFIVYDLSFFF